MVYLKASSKIYGSSSCNMIGNQRTICTFTVTCTNARLNIRNKSVISYLQNSLSPSFSHLSRLFQTTQDLDIFNFFIK